MFFLNEMKAITITIFNHSRAEKSDAANEQNPPDTFSAEQVTKRNANGAITAEVARNAAGVGGWGSVYLHKRPALNNDNGLLPPFKRRSLSKCHILPSLRGTERVFPSCESAEDNGKKCLFP